MKPITTTALALVAVFAAAPAAAQYGTTVQQKLETPQTAQSQQEPAKQPATPTVKPSGKAQKAIIELQDAVNKSDWANLPAKVAAAQAVASTKEDRYLIGQLQLKAALATNNSSAMASAIDAIAASNYLDATKTASLYRGLGGTLLNAKQYAQAAPAFQKALSLDPSNSEAARLLGVSLFQQGQKAEAATALQKAIQASAAAGQKPSEDLYRLALQSAFDAKLPVATDLARQWLAAYPSADSWRNSIAVYRAMNQTDVEGTLDLFRLMQATGSLKEQGDYTLFATRAIEQNNYNEAKAVMEAGIAAKVVDAANPEIRNFIADIKKKQIATAADLAEATKTAVNGMALLRIGDRYYAMGDYAKAAELYRMAMSKPGVDKNVANLHIGMALARSGDKAGATAALSAVAGERADIAKYWLTYVNQKG
jgi:tetratricopeptide (TPR) repeat protein